MTDVLTHSRTAKTVLAGFFLTLFTVLFLSLTPTVAFAAGCGTQDAFGCDTGAPPSQGGNGNGGGGQTTPPSTGGGGGGGTGGGGGGGTAPIDPYGSVTRIMDGTGCAVRNDGKAAVGSDHYFTRIFDKGVDRETGPGGGYAWEYDGYFPGYGYRYSTEVFVKRVCLYPPRTYTTTLTCVISSTATVDMVAPSRKNLGSKRTTSGYSQGSTNYNACQNSSTKANVGISLNEYGFYSSTAVSLAQIATVEIATTANEATGEFPAPKIIALSAPFNMAPRAATASVDCASGFRSPGVMRTDWTENACSSSNSSNPSFICQAPAVMVDGGDGNTTQLKPVANGQTLQLMRDGKSRSMTFNQRAVGAGINVQSVGYTFRRDGGSTPWDNGSTYANNLFELRKSEKGASILSRSQGTATASYSGMKTVWAVGLAASEYGAPTTITQELRWTGTRTIRTATITSIDGRTGAITAVQTTRNVPTSGNCSQSVRLEYIRAIGDSIR